MLQKIITGSAETLKYDGCLKLDPGAYQSHDMPLSEITKLGLKNFNYTDLATTIHNLKQRLTS